VDSKAELCDQLNLVKYSNVKYRYKYIGFGASTGHLCNYNQVY